MLLFTQGSGIPLLSLDPEIWHSDSTIIACGWGSFGMLTKILFFASTFCSFSGKGNPQSWGGEEQPEVVICCWFLSDPHVLTSSHCCWSFCSTAALLGLKRAVEVTPAQGQEGKHQLIPDQGCFLKLKSINTFFMYVCNTTVQSLTG